METNHNHLSLEARFAARNVPLVELERFLGKPLTQADDREYRYLTNLVGEIERGRAVWSEVLEYKLIADLEKEPA